MKKKKITKKKKKKVAKKKTPTVTTTTTPEVSKTYEFRYNRRTHRMEKILSETEGTDQ